jgi:hypothetical protein
MATKALVSTTETQNDYPGDFTWTEEGEVVVSNALGMCDSHLLARDGLSRCGCDRAWSGTRTGKATTTAVVAEVEHTRLELVKQYAERIQTAYDMTEREALDAAHDVMEETLDFAAGLPAGQVVRCTAETMFAVPA